MKPYLLIISCLFSLSLLAQERKVDTLYFDYTGMPTEKDNLFVARYKLVEQKDSLFYVESYDNTTKKLKSTGTYSDKDLNTMEGYFVYYGDSGKVSSDRNYRNNLPEGLYREFFDSGELYYAENYTAGKLNGSVLAYYESGKLKRNDTYRNGSLVYGKCFDEDSVEIAHFDWFTEAQYVGGMEAMKKFLIENISYPKKARKAGRVGKVIVRFVVTDEGEITNVVVKKSAGEDFDNEAVRVVKKMPKWEPAQRDGKTIKCYFDLPVTFTF